MLGSMKRMAAALVLVLIVTGALFCVGSAEAAPQEPRAAGQTPFSALAPSRASGVLLERVPVGGYLYARVLLDDGEQRIVASLKKPLAPGERVRITFIGHERDFRSNRLMRTFPDLWFGIIQAE
jgi:hypothetical protein